MQNDHVATLPLVHWPSPVATWYDDFGEAPLTRRARPLGHVE